MSPQLWDRRDNFRNNSRWAQTVIQPLAIPHYQKVWPGCSIEELDIDTSNAISRYLDIGGADKMIRASNGQCWFLGQRFRSYEIPYNDFTLRTTEWERVKRSYESQGLVPGFYAYGQATRSEQDFKYLIILDFRGFVGWAIQRPDPWAKPNKDGTKFHNWPFQTIPWGLKIYSYPYAQGALGI